jgi:hypothetical protein
MVAVTLATARLAKPDIVISTSPQFFNGLAGWFVSRLKRVPWSVEIRDLWPESIVTVGGSKNPLIIRALQRLELFAYRRAEVIVPVSRGDVVLATVNPGMQALLKPARCARPVRGSDRACRRSMVRGF